jgi:predicted phage terminase large subunit-like protein
MGADPTPQPKKATLRDKLGKRLAERRVLAETTKLESDRAAFFKWAWTIIEPETPLVWSFHYDLLAEWLTMISSGEFKRRYPEKDGLVICVPFRSAKSSLVTIAWPVFTWLRFPAKRFLCASYSDRLACDHSIRRRNLILSHLFQEKFGSRFSLTDDQNRVDHYANNKTGYCTATSVGGSVTGQGADFLLGDDLLSQDGSYSDATRAGTNRWIDSTWSTRRNDPASGVFAYVQQRLAEDDPPGHVMEQKDKFVLLRVPLEAEEDESYVFPLSGRTHERKKGDVLMPARFTPAVVEALKQQSSVWSGQCQQNPAPAGGGIIKSHWWRFYVRPGDPVPPDCVVMPTEFEEMAQSWDMSFKDKKTSDFVVGGVWGRVKATKYLMPDLIWERLNFPDTKKAVVALTGRWPKAHAKWIEDKANGTAIIDELKTDIAGLIAVEPSGSKEARLHAAAPDVEAGNVVLPHPSICTWTRRFIDECAAACCGGKFDDAADMLSQAINQFRNPILSGWVCVGATRSKNEQAATASAKTPRELAEAQIRDLPADTPGAFHTARLRALDKKITDKAATNPACPECGKACSGTKEWQHCNSCGWDSRKAVVAQ